jgi:hypothetical protein
MKNAIRLRLRWFNVICFILILIMLAGSLFLPVDVLKNWTLETDTTKSYKLGDEITVHSKFDKVRTVSTKPDLPPERKFQCKDEQGRWGATIPFGNGSGDHPSGAGSRDIVGRIPVNVPARLPAECRMCAYIKYPITPFRDFFRGLHVEQNCTKGFKVDSSSVDVSQQPDLIIIEPSPTEPSHSRSVPFQRSSPNPNPAPNTPQTFIQSESSNEQPDNTVTPPENSPPTVECTVIRLDLILGRVCL